MKQCKKPTQCTYTDNILNFLFDNWVNPLCFKANKIKLFLLNTNLISMLNICKVEITHAGVTLTNVSI